MFVTSTAEAAAIRGRLEYRTKPYVGVDCETVDIDPRTQPAAGPYGRIVCWSVAWYEGSEVVSAVIWANPETRAVLGSYLQELPAVGHNLWGFDCHLFRRSGFPLAVHHDTLRLHRLINGSDDAEHGLKALIRWWLPHWKVVGDFDELFTKRKSLGVVSLGERGAKKTKRKVAGESIPTLVAGDYTRLGAGTEFVRLDCIPSDYPKLLPVLIEYAALDAVAALVLFEMFAERLGEMPWSTQLGMNSQHSGTKHAG